jgi:hypothetical protein
MARCIVLSLALLAVGCQLPRADESPVRSAYDKREHRIPMRDGMHLFTAVYSPKDLSKIYPIMLLRTPYSLRPYGEDLYRRSLGPSRWLAEDGYIFVYQDVRGCYMSEGVFDNMRPHRPNKGPEDIDESTDTYDSIEWLLNHIPNHNGRVGMWGISYPGFYCAAGMVDAHPALTAVSPQAPIADWYFDDFHHNGAFFLPHAFNFMASFGKPREEPTTSRGSRFEHGTPDGYAFFLEMGSLKNANERHLHGEVPFWNEMMAHPNYDSFWQARNILPHLNNVAPAVMTVGGWFDAEDLYGPLNIYRSIEQRNPDVHNTLVMGPWRHGGWARDSGARLGNISFGTKTSEYYQEFVERPFFDHHLKDGPEPEIPEALVFETGANRWQSFDAWPPEERRLESLFLSGRGALTFDAPEDERAYSEFVSDLDHPVPFTEEIRTGMTREYMTADQRFASRRPDVLTFQTPALEQPITVAGPIVAHLWCETTAGDADWIVKVIDVLPPDTRSSKGVKTTRPLGGYQMMVRSEVLRGRYRDSYTDPQPFQSGEPTLVKVPLQDVLHTFGKGHRIMVQIQSTWFPLVDRNPQKYVENINLAEEEDFVRATHRVHHSQTHSSFLQMGILDLAPAVED